MTVHPRPSVSINASPANATVCEGETFSVEAITDLGNAGYNRSGPNGFASDKPSETISNAEPAQSGLYSVTITDANGCTKSASAQAVVASPPTLTATASGNQISASATGGTGPYTYTISGGIYGSCLQQMRLWHGPFFPRARPGRHEQSRNFPVIKLMEFMPPVDIRILPFLFKPAMVL